MPRERYKKKREDLRKGGRVKYSHGGRPQRRNFNTKEEFQQALEQWQNDPAHTSGQGSTPDKPTTPKETRDIYTPDTEAKITKAIETAEATRKGETTFPKLPTITTEAGTKLDTTISTPDTDIEQIKKIDVGTATAGKAATPEEQAARRARVIPSGDAETSGTQPDITAATYQAARAGVTSPEALLDQYYASRAPIAGIPDPTPAYNPETGRIERGGVETPFQSWTPEEFATEFDLSITGIQDIVGAEGELSEGAKAKVDEIRELTSPAEAQTITDALIDSAKAQKENRPVEEIISAGAYVPYVPGFGAQVSPTPDAEKNSREAITGVPATGTEAQIINNINFDAAQRDAVQGTARTGAAATMIAETAAIPQDIAAAIVEDPSVVEAKIDTQPVEVQAAVAALPTEALVSSQMENLLGSLESGTVPAWAKPAVDAVNQNLADRGMEISTVGRDALFNSIIQMAFPIAQNNSQALQARAAQNLSNEQQANLTQSTQDMQRRMANLANQQTASSQTAANAQQMAVLQSQFKQEAVLTTAQQQQQTAMANLQNRQQAAVLNAQNEQAMNAQNLSVGAQMDLANLQIQDATARENMTAVQQERMAEYQVAAQFLSQNAGFKQQMNLANLSADQQMKLANLSALNQASSENLTAEQQTDLANLNKRMQINIKNGELANSMGLAQLNVDQQRAMQNAGMVANMDMSKFTTNQQIELANSKWMQTSRLTNLSNQQQAAIQDATALASLDLATLDQRTRIAAQHAQAFLQMDMANLNNDQQAVILSAQQRQQRLLSNQAAENAARQFNSTSVNQTNQFMTSLGQQVELNNTAQLNAMEQFNVQTQAQAEAQIRGLEVDENKLNAQLATQVSQYNTQIAYDRSKWNATNAQAIEQSNISWRRQANTINTAASNQIAMQNAQNLFGMSAQAQSFLWQELRDRAAYEFQAGEKFEDRKTHLIAQAAANDASSAAYWEQLTTSNISKLFGALIPVGTDTDED